MGIQVTLEILLGGILFALGAVGLALGPHLRGAQVSLVFSTLAGLFCVLRAWGFQAGSVEEAAALMRWRHLVAGLGFTVLPWYLAASFPRCGRRFPIVASLCGLALVIVALLSPAGASRSSIDQLIQVVKPWGETMVEAVGERSPFILVLWICCVVQAVFLVWCTFRHWAVIGWLERSCYIIAGAILLIGISLSLASAYGIIAPTLRIGAWCLPFLAGAFVLRIADQVRASDRDYRRICDGLADAIFIHDAVTGRTLEVSAAAESIFGFERKVLLSLRPPQLMHESTPLDEAVFIDLIHRAATGEQFTVNLSIRHRDGHAVPVEVSLRSLHLRGRDCVIAAVRDISERVTAERKAAEHERRLVELVERAPIAMRLGTSDGRITYVNRAFTAQYGYTLAEIPTVDEAFRLLYPDPVYRSERRRLYDQSVTRGPEIQATESRMTAKDGRQVDTIASGAMVGDQHLSFFVDVSELRRIQEQSETQARFLEAVIANAADGVCVGRPLSEHPQVAFSIWNRRMVDITGYTRDQINELGWFRTLFTDDQQRSRALAALARLRQGGQPEAEEWAIATRDGTARTVQLASSLIPSGHDGAGHVLTVLRDVTRQRAAEAEKRQLEAQVQHTQKLESLGVLAGGIAHDFNNILMSVLGRASLAGSIITPGHAASPHLQEIEHAAKRAAELCRQMLAYAGKGRFVVERLDLMQVVLEMGRMLEIGISKKVVLKYEFAEGLPAIEADASQLRQVVMNLITNASEAIGDRSGVISVRTGAMACDRDYLSETYLDDDLPEGTYVYLEVADTGCGMNAETRTRLFEPFFSTKFTGRGLGMAAVLGIVRGHRAAIKVYSELGRGTTIKALFPAVGQPVVSTAEATPVAVGRLPQGTTVLVVDDEETIRTLARDMLLSLGMRVLLAEDGREAVELFRGAHDRIALVILDLTMPHMDGEEAYRELRRIDRDVKVVMTSGYNQQEVTQRFAGKGLVGFLQKPYNLSALLQVLNQVIGQTDPPKS